MKPVAPVSRTLTHYLQGLSNAPHFREQYYSRSRANVLRGMHFQLPPYDHDKLVYCVAGRALDVILDLRRDSETYGQVVSLQLDELKGNGAYVPRGCAHGFLSLEDDTILFYNLTAEYSPAHDTGILWNTFGFDWPASDPVLSERDSGFPKFGAFDSPWR